MSVQEIIKSRRLELGLTLKEVANALRVSESTVSRYESGDIQHMGIDKIESLSKVLQCSPGYLMGCEKKFDENISLETSQAFRLTKLELEIIKRFRVLTNGKRSMFLRTLGLKDTEKGDESQLA